MSNQPLATGTSADMSPVEEATARSLILALLHRYAALAREENEYSRITELFESGGTIRFPDGRELPISQLGEITRAQSPNLLRHHLTTVDIQFTSSTEAQCQSYVVAGTEVKMPDHWGRWDAQVRKQTDGKWLYQKKVVLVDGFDPEGWLAKTYGADAFGK